MMVLVTYDVSMQDSMGPKRLRRVARACKDFGQRVQYSVFEIEVDPAQWVALKDRLIHCINPATDSLRFYFLGAEWQKRVEHLGAKPTLDLHGPLLM